VHQTSKNFQDISRVINTQHSRRLSEQRLGLVARQLGTLTGSFAVGQSVRDSDPRGNVQALCLLANATQGTVCGDKGLIEGSGLLPCKASVLIENGIAAPALEFAEARNHATGAVLVRDIRYEFDSKDDKKQRLTLPWLQ
jgi:hypothetical protein